MGPTSSEHGLQSMVCTRAVWAPLSDWSRASGCCCYQDRRAGLAQHSLNCSVWSPMIHLSFHALG